MDRLEVRVSITKLLLALIVVIVPLSVIGLIFLLPLSAALFWQVDTPPVPLPPARVARSFTVTEPGITPVKVLAVRSRFTPRLTT